MQRNPMQDIVPKGKSIRNIPLPESRPRTASRGVRETREIKETREVVEEEEEQVEEAPRREYDFDRDMGGTKKPRRSKKLLVWGIGILVILGLAAFVVNLFHSATLTVTPKTVVSAVNADFTAKNASSTSASGLLYHLVSIKQTEGQTVKATGEEQVDKKATGTIIIYNNYNATAQRLIKNTRFATPEGLIFRITDSVTVPGKSGSTPGSVEAIVVADASGADYNVGLKDFTIPGFKGDPRYTTFYARSKTAIDGGFSGTQKIVADADRMKAKIAIETALRSELLTAVLAAKPDGAVFFSNAYTVDFKELPDQAASSGQATIQEEGTISAAVFDSRSISSAIAQSAVKDYKGDPVTVQNIESLSFQPKDFKPGSSDSIAFHISGSATVEWLYDEAAFKDALKGQPQSSIQTILQEFPTIEKANISMRPFWSSSFPTDLSKITVKKE